MNKLKQLWYFVQWSCKKYPVQLAIYCSVLITVLMVMIYGKKACVIIMMIVTVILIFAFCYMAVQHFIALPIRTAYAEYKAEKQAVFDSLQR